MKTLALLFCLLALPLFVDAQVPNLVSYQGRVAVGTVNFEGTGQFRFALVNAAGTTVYWGNAADTTPADGVPDAAVSLAVSKGLYSVLLGDTSIANMASIPASVWANADVRLRVWFNDGVNGNQLLTPDQRLAPSGYLPAGSVASAAIADGAVNSAKMAAGSVTSTQLAANAVQSAHIAAGASAAPVSIAGTTQTAAANTSYVATSASPATINLPATATVGDVVQVTGVGAGGWTTTQYDPSPVAWTARESSRGWRAVALSADGGKLVAVVQNGQIYTSTDSGVSWTARESSRSWRTVASSADGTKLVAAVNGGQIYTSTDSGLSWTARETSRSWRTVASSADGTKLVAVVNSGQIYTSTDSGVNWTARESSRGWNYVASSADGSKLAAVVFNGQIYTSTDSGVSWTARESSRPWNAVASSADGSKLVAVVNNGGQIYTSTDSGVTWTARESGRDWFTVASSADGGKLVAVVTNGGQIYTSTDSGVTWTARESARNWQSVASSADGSRLVAAVNGGQIYTSGTNVAVASGAQGSHATLQYLGNGQWAPVAESQLAAGAVGSNQLAAGAVGSNQLAAGAVGSNQLAAGAVGSAQLGSDLALSGTTTGTFSGNGSGLTNLPNAATTGTAVNTPNTLVLRDGSGDFSAHSLTLSGSLSLPATTAGGDGVVSIGGNRVLHTYGSDNVFVGRDAGNLTMTGSFNTASGYAALSSNTEGDANTASGGFALYSNETGINNTASGAEALSSNTTGSYNTASGWAALYFNETGSGNTASGMEALFFNTTGSYNTASGLGALYSNTTGAYNIALGYFAGSNLTTTHNNICIGNPGVAGDSGIIRIGTNGTHQKTLLVGNVGIGTATPTQAKFVVSGGANTSAGQFGNVRYFNPQIDGTVGNWDGGLVSIYASDNIVASGIGLFSDARIKNITGRSSSVTDLETLQKIEITDYTMKDTAAKGAGTIKKVIAQQVEKTFPQAVTRGQGIIPDIYQAAAVENGWVMLATDLKPGDRVKLLGEKDEAVHEILEVEKERFRPAAIPAGGKVFVYGREVDDLRRVDYDAISMLNVSATQELAKKLAAKDAEIARLAAENAEMKKQLATQAERDKAIEAHLARLEQNVQAAPVQTVKVALKK